MKWMDLEFIDISQHGEERRASGNRNRSYVNGSAVRADGNVPESQYRRRKPASGNARRTGVPGREQVQGRSDGGRRQLEEPIRRRSDGRKRQLEEPIRRRNEDKRRQEARRRPATPEEIERRRQKILKKRKQQRQQRMIKGIILTCEAAFVILLCVLVYHFVRSFRETDKIPAAKQAGSEETAKIIEENHTSKPAMTEDFLTLNPYSRPGESLESVHNIFVHYTANKGTSAAQNRSYFENLGTTGETSASAHFIIGFEGEIIQCVPLTEIAYAVMGRNYDSVSIECCYLDDDGEFTWATYQSLIRLCAWLLDEYDLTPEDILRHYDEGGKKCPLYYVDNEGKWEQFKQDVEQYILEKPTV